MPGSSQQVGGGGKGERGGGVNIIEIHCILSIKIAQLNPVKTHQKKRLEGGRVVKKK
jgi:hypothetical protein